MIVEKYKVFFSEENLRKAYKDTHLADLYGFLNRNVNWSSSKWRAEYGYEVWVYTKSGIPERKAFFNLEKELSSALDYYVPSLPGHRFSLHYKCNDFDRGVRFGMLSPEVTSKEEILLSEDLIKEIWSESAKEKQEKELKKKVDGRISLADRARYSLNFKVRG